MKRFFVEHEQQWKWVWAQLYNDQLWFHINGQTFLATLQNQKQSRNTVSQKNGSGEVSAPMPGKILKVLRQEGESVLAGDVVIVMEAMKMEYSLEADKKGVVEKILIKEGQQVVVGELLAKVN